MESLIEELEREEKRGKERKGEKENAKMGEARRIAEKNSGVGGEEEEEEGSEDDDDSAERLF